MGTLKIITLLCSMSYCIASHHSHIIPIEGYETELQDLGEHTITHDPPVKIIKITKTVGVKVPIPYPVKVVQKVPYPVHVAKPYPVPVPQIVKIPQSSAPQSHHEHQRSDGGHPSVGNSYDVQENHQGGGPGDYDPSSEDDSYGGGNYGNYQNAQLSNGYASEGVPAQSYGPPSSFYGSSGGQDGSNSFDSRSYDEAIQKYLDEHPTNRQNDDSHHY